MSESVPELRIGSAERTSAMKALDEHLAAGRLCVDEYADRSAAASVATTRSELATLFADLPAPHPALPGPPAPRSVPAPAPRDPSQPLFGAWGPRIVAVAPLVALALFFLTTHTWLWFLLIPAAGAIVYGSRHDGHDRRRDHRERP